MKSWFVGFALIACAIVALAQPKSPEYNSPFVVTDTAVASDDVAVVSDDVPQYKADDGFYYKKCNGVWMKYICSPHWVPLSEAKDCKCSCAQVQSSQPMWINQGNGWECNGRSCRRCR